ncbi:uncharacterized protein LOC133202610 isoform X2 [Saccostrea echinata]|uniref:uncharacterized protein LOC133202610 isoform X2 n=1 Tax=Saccostrea echinata TaxID=191078 RepID=UPI002A7FE776|nr:uncharacterized protein LOC133202610 isoform X2 [Saccostrea echinata]
MENHENRKYKVILTRRLADQRKVDVEGVCLNPDRNGQDVESTNQRIYDRESRCFLCTSSADKVDHLVGLDHLEAGGSSVGVGVDESKKKNGQHVELQTRDSTTENPGASEGTSSADEVDNLVGQRVDHTEAVECTSSADEVDNLDRFEAGDSSVGVGVDESKKKNGQHVELQTRDSTTENPGASEGTSSADEVDNLVDQRVDHTEAVDSSVGDLVKESKKTNQFYPFSCIDFIGISISLIFFCIDVFTDILLAKSYYDDGMMFECVLTSSLVAAAFLVTGILSSIWHTQEPSRRNICLLILMFPFATIERYP